MLKSRVNSTIWPLLGSHFVNPPLRLSRVSAVGVSKSPSDENTQAAAGGIDTYLCIEEEEADFIDPTGRKFASITAAVQ